MGFTLVRVGHFFFKRDWTLDPLLSSDTLLTRSPLWKSRLGLTLAQFARLRRKLHLEPPFSQGLVVMPGFSEDTPGGYWWITAKANSQIIFCFLNLGFAQSLVVI